MQSFSAIIHTVFCTQMVNTFVLDLPQYLGLQLVFNMELLQQLFPPLPEPASAQHTSDSNPEHLQIAVQDQIIQITTTYTRQGTHHLFRLVKDR